MRSVILILALMMSLSLGCKSKQATASTSTASEQTVSITKTIGKVSHQYQSTGCSTVIIIAGENGSITLIPKDKLSKDLDIDGLEISFDYHTLKMPQPAGCTVGMPAELTNITKTKK